MENLLKFKTKQTSRALKHILQGASFLYGFEGKTFVKISPSYKGLCAIVSEKNEYDVIMASESCMITFHEYGFSPCELMPGDVFRFVEDGKDMPTPIKVLATQDNLILCVDVGKSLEHTFTMPRDSFSKIKIHL
jgi:hypothetical protein